MPGLIVIRIVPQGPVDALTFADYLADLTIEAFELTFSTVDGTPPGVSVGTAAYIAASGWNPVSGNPAQSSTAPSYPTPITAGIIQQVDFVPPVFPDPDGVFQYESVGIAIIPVTSAGIYGNFRLDIEQGGQKLSSIPYQYSRALQPGNTPDPASWGTLSNRVFLSDWAALEPDTYVSVPASATTGALQLPADGTPPPFDELRTAVAQVLSEDPGVVAPVATSAVAPAGTTSLTLAGVDDLTVGMSATAANIPPGATVIAIGPGDSVTLSAELTAQIASGTAITFGPDLAALSFSQCQNIAYEIIWGQQPPMPSPPDPVEDLYTNPPNNGVMLSGSTPNPYEGDRMQFEGQLQSYYSVADTTADRLTSFVFALSAAIACEQQSLAATQALLHFPVLSAPGDGISATETSVILSGVQGAGVTGSFGVPAAYFYALAAPMPVQITAAQRFARATGDQLARVLTDLTTAINAGTVSDAESCYSAATVTISAAQAARRLYALGVPVGSTTGLAPLGSVAVPTSADATSGSEVTLTDVTGVGQGMLVSGTGIAPDTTVDTVAGGTVTMSETILGDVPAGSMLVFTPPYVADLKGLVAAWLAYPATPAGAISTEAYQPTDDDQKLWPSVAVSNPTAYLGLVLASLTQGYVIPPPFDVALGSEIAAFLATLPGAAMPPTAATLASVSVQQWTALFTENPTWLPPFTEPGNLDARIAAFIAAAQRLLPVISSGPRSVVILATSAASAPGTATLQFAGTAGVVAGMDVSGTGVAAGTTVLSVTATTVDLSQPVAAGGVVVHANITFSPGFAGAAAAPAPPTLEAPSIDWLQSALTAYGTFTFGSGFDVDRLTAAVAEVFDDDRHAQQWLLDALISIDALYQVVNPLALAAPGLAFSVVEALYARGFRAAADVTALDTGQFKEALLGTVAFESASALYAAAATIAPPASPTAPDDGFAPINPDGELTDCLPAPCASPLSPIAYLQEMLTLSELSTCEAVVAAPLSLTTAHDAAVGDSQLTFISAAGVAPGMSASGPGIPGDTTVRAVSATTVTISQTLTAAVPAGTVVTATAPKLGTVLEARRGPLGSLTASCANLETPLPLIDIVNECLEFLGAATPATSGTVYDTSGDEVAGHILCAGEPCPDETNLEDCHDPASLFGALPEYSTPATPVEANTAVEPAVFNDLKTDFSSCRLPYSQALDVSRTYLRHLGSCRYEEMRTFRKCITEFVLDPTDEPSGFQSWLWRYPVRIDIAIEYLGITLEEYQTLFLGAAAPPCAPSVADPSAGSRPAGSQPTDPTTAAQPPNQSPAANPVAALAVEQGDPIPLPGFLQATCLSYCEFYELWESGFVEFANGAAQPSADDHGTERAASEAAGAFPQCEPCCLDELWLEFKEGTQVTGLRNLEVFIRLWHKLRESCCFCYSFAQLRDICDVLGLVAGGQLNPDFVRQLAGFQMLREDFGMDLVDPGAHPAPGAVDADRTHLLALWVGPGAAEWDWAVGRLIEQVEEHAQRRHDCDRRSPEFIKLLVANLDPLSQLAGFDPASATDSWHARPIHTLRFAEVLAKIYASDFSVGELLYLFTAQPHLDGDDPFPLQTDNEALDLPLGLPAEESAPSLWRLREEMLAAEVDDDECEAWPWRRIESALQSELGFAPADVSALGQHFFPEVLAHAGYQVPHAATLFVSPLASGDTSAAMWDNPPDGPLRYDATAEQLSIELPFTDHAVIANLTHVGELSAPEGQAVQDLFFAPRAMLARFALLFSDFATAQRRLIEDDEEGERFAYFRRQFLLCHHRCRIIARHLTHHVAAATGQELPEGDREAVLILRTLAADENAATTSWEDDSGAAPDLTWTPPPTGGALAALLGLTGTGLVTEYMPTGGALAWRDISGPLSGFGQTRDRENCPVPTVVPSLNATLSPEQLQFASVHNGLLMKDATDDWLGGAQGFAVMWSGALLVQNEGTYEFWAGAPTPDDERPSFDAAEHRRWRIVISRGQRSWVILSHHWPGEEELRSTSLPLRRGAYELTVEMVQSDPEFTDDEQLRRQHTGFQVKYAGPDSEDRRIEVPHSHLFAIDKDQTLGTGIEAVSPSAASYLADLYVSSLRDIRRTYQRAFKALLVAHRFRLSAHRDRAAGTSELGCLIDQPDRFAGAGYYRSGAGFTRHLADFEFDFLPLLDDYHAPESDLRITPSPQRVQAMFDWWERIFDYTVARAEVRRRCDRHLWRLFEEAREKQPAHPAYLLRHLGADARHWELDLRYFQGQTAPVYAVTSGDLEDDRWTLRAWHADRWLRTMQCCFACPDPVAARPDLWASDDPTAALPGETETGNANVTAFVGDGCLENGKPRRYGELRRLNDGLRERGRDALVAHLCHADRVALPWSPGHHATVPRDLSDLLLLDVEAGIREKASRIEDAITAAQSYVRRARLGLEPGWTVTPAFAQLWDREFATLRVWQACRRRRLYKENFVEWDELGKARDVEAFRFLEDRLRDPQLTISAPGGLEWWPDKRLPAHDSLELIQNAQGADLARLKVPREGLGLLGAPERQARRSWLAAAGGQVRKGRDPQADAVVIKPDDSEFEDLPYWLQTAIRLGTRFWRIDAAGVPQADHRFAPHPHHGPEDCVACCEECGCEHPAKLDEYYFWLVDGAVYTPPATPTPTGFSAPPPGNYQDGYQLDFYDPAQQQAALWQDTHQLPQLLQWKGSPTVRLAWCRVHNGIFGPPRRSTFDVSVTPGGDADLTFLGRTADSLTFSVGNSVPPDGFGDTSAPGFRYDLATDDAVVLPQVSPPAALPTFLGDLPAYPYFVYFAPGAPLFPLTPFAPALAISRALRSHCRFEGALQWYRLAFDPLTRDCTWVECESGERQPPPPVDGAGAVAAAQRNGNNGNVRGGNPPGACCDSTDITCAQARDRATLLHYLETLVEWGDATRRRGNDPEAFQQARVIFDAARLILGRRPRVVRLRPPSDPPSVTDFTPAFPPLNPRLMDVYDVVEDRLALIRADIDARRLREGRPGRDMPYFGNDRLPEAWKSAEDGCAELCDWCHLPSPYRFTFLIEKAQEWSAKVEQLGAALLAAFEKGDAEFLEALRAGQGLELLGLALEAKKDQWRDADWQVEALQTGKSVSQANLIYTNGLINAGPEGLINGELQYQSLAGSALSLRGEADVIENIGEGLRLIPDIVLGAAGFGGSPVSIAWIPLGTKVGDAMEAVARIINNGAEIDSMTASLDQTNAEWLRRFNEWQHQAQILAIEIHQAEQQILGAQRRRDQALNDLNAHRRQIEHATEVDDFLRDRFTAHDLYLFLQNETLALYRGTYDLALQAARQAQQAFNLERGHTTRHFIPGGGWDSLHDALLAGERLSGALRHMQKAYLDDDTREYELTKNISLRLHFPLAFTRLRTTGRCEIEIPEWMFDLDAPGMYMRRIKSVCLTIPCVTGPYTGIHCRLTLIGSTTRVHPALRAPVHECCCPPEPCSCERCTEHGVAAYELCPDDPRAVRQYDAREAIATSSGQNDSGLFELSFHDPRYLPFEYMGAVSRWRLELPPENNFFDFDSLTDTVIRVSYTARDGGELLRRAASASAQRHLPGDGWHFFDVCHDFPDAWQLLRDAADRGPHAEPLKLVLARRMFPFIPGAPCLKVDKIAIVFGACGGKSCESIAGDGCPCPGRHDAAERQIEFIHGHRDARTITDVRCVAGERWPAMYCGMVDTDLGPLDADQNCREFELRFPVETGRLERVFLLCRYRVASAHDHCGHTDRVHGVNGASAY